MQTKPTVRNSMVELGAYLSPKNVIHKVTSEYGGLFNAKSPVDVPRDRSQAYYQSKQIPNRKRQRNTGPLRNADYSKIALMVNNTDCIRHYEFAGNNKGTLMPRTSACPKNYEKWIKTFCSRRLT